MGINCKDIINIVHWGPPSNITEYVQETGHAGCDSLQHARCDGLPDEVVLFKGKLGRYTSHGIKNIYGTMLHVDN